jgi:hypothetical protein
MRANPHGKEEVMSKVWRVTFDLIVSDNWIDDGFTLTPQVLKTILQDGILQYAYDSEKTVENAHIRALNTERPQL